MWQIIFLAIASQKVWADTECPAVAQNHVFDEDTGLSLLQLQSKAVTAVCSRAKKYVLNGTDTKCAYKHSDRLFREEGKDTNSCYHECLKTENCNYFSIAETGPFAGVCMGCKYGVTDPHDNFKFYAMCPGLHGECRVLGDPHITGFDENTFSLVNTDGNGHDVVDVYGSGVYWLVKSDKISIQAMYNKVYYPKSKEPLSHTYMTALAVGGAFLDGHILLIEPANGEVTWKGNGKMRSILTSVPSTFRDFSKLVEGSATRGATMAAKHNLTNIDEDGTGKAVNLHFELPHGVALHVDRFDKHLDMKISMVRSAAGRGEMSGQCGNFNGLESDDNKDALMGQKVPENEWLIQV